MIKNIKKTQDMSVEEILKSIRGIISKHQDDKPIDEDVLELTDVVANKHPNAASVLDLSEDYIIDESTRLDASDSLKQFAEKAKTASQSAKKSKTLTVEEMVAQMMRPQLKDWLDKNLPILVRELVEKELKRLTPGADEDE